jgi:hypothetical protein
MSEKYKNEIEEILRQVEGVDPADQTTNRARKFRNSPTVKRSVSSPNQAGPGLPRRQLWPSFSTRAFTATGLIFLFVGALIWNLLIWVGFGLLAVAFIYSFAKPRSISYEKRWRGQPIEEHFSILERLKRWLKI